MLSLWLHAGTKIATFTEKNELFCKNVSKQMNFSAMLANFIPQEVTKKASFCVYLHPN